jgi:hypothetical protein
MDQALQLGLGALLCLLTVRARLLHLASLHIPPWGIFAFSISQNKSLVKQKIAAPKRVPRTVIYMYRKP